MSSSFSGVRFGCGETRGLSGGSYLESGSRGRPKFPLLDSSKITTPKHANPKTHISRDISISAADALSQHKTSLELVTMALPCMLTSMARRNREILWLTNFSLDSDSK